MQVSPLYNSASLIVPRFSSTPPRPYVRRFPVKHPPQLVDILRRLESEAAVGKTISTMTPNGSPRLISDMIKALRWVLSPQSADPHHLAAKLGKKKKSA